MDVGLFSFFKAFSHAAAVSVRFAGLQVDIFGVALNVERCSIGWWVGPSSPRAIES